MNNSRTEQPIKAYDLNAQKYEAKFSNYPTYRDKIRDFHNKHIPPGATLLDLGCGPGQNIRAILELDRSIRATGIDLSREFISIASRQNPAAKFLQADIRKLSAESRYDVILASFCIVHLKRAETENLLSSIAESLADNGKLYLMFYARDRFRLRDHQLFRPGNILQLLPVPRHCPGAEKNSLQVLEKQTEDYPEPDGTTTTDVVV